MVKITIMATINISCFYSFLLSCIYKSYWWQYTIKQREVTPFYCAMVESSVCAQMGYHKGVRKRIDENVSSTIGWHIPWEQLRLREEVTQAITSLGWRSRLVQQVVVQRKKQEIPKDMQMDGLLELVNYGDMFEENEGASKKTTEDLVKIQ